MPCFPYTVRTSGGHDSRRPTVAGVAEAAGAEIRGEARSLRCHRRAVLRVGKHGHGVYETARTGVCLSMTGNAFGRHVGTLPGFPRFTGMAR